MKTENSIRERTYLLNSMPFAKTLIYEGKLEKGVLKLSCGTSNKNRFLLETFKPEIQVMDVKVPIKGEISNFDEQLMNFLKEEQERQILELISQSNCVDKKQYHIINSDDVVEGANRIDEIFSEPKVIYIHPKQTLQIENVAGFLPIEKYSILDSIKVNGAIGTIGSCQVVKSENVLKESNFYLNPMIKWEFPEDEQEMPAVTILIEIIKRDVEENVVTVNYEIGITNATKILTVKFHK